MKHAFLLLSLLIFAAPPARAIEFEKKIYLEEMTWPEIKKRLDEGSTTVVIPTGGTEQNGPHIVTGKHNFIVRYTAGEIARGLGDAMVAPVIAYVPEGRINPPEGHMRFPGTISVAESTFGAILEDAARSLKQHGFKLICFIGDHGGNQDVQERIADKLNEEWHGRGGVRVLHVSRYYGDNGQDKWAASHAPKQRKPDAHAGYFDTSEMLALEPENVRSGEIQSFSEEDYATRGASGDAAAGTAEAGRALLALKVNAAIEQIRYAKSRR